MSFKSKIIEIIDSEVKKQSNYQNIITKQANTANSGVQMGIVDSYDQEKGTLTIRTSNGTLVEGIQPGSSPVGPGTTGFIMAGTSFMSP